MRATSGGCTGTLRQLTAAGADLSQKNNKGQTALAAVLRTKAKG